ncbi:hypothetical protein B0H11DRAFT_1898397 [Mycena galericulata]|nr:hypothetical protein B0H11DRAFT_1898397 [Mycena galericulata]
MKIWVMSSVNWRRRAEYGAIYSIATVITLALYVSKANSGAISGGALGQISCLIPTSIIVRIGFVNSSPTNYIPSLRATRPPGNDPQGTGYQNDTAMVVMSPRTQIDSCLSSTQTAGTYAGTESKSDGLV